MLPAAEVESKSQAYTRQHVYAYMKMAENEPRAFIIFP